VGSREISKAAFAEAKRLGHAWVGPEHGLLAILMGEPADVARRALEEAGLEAGQFERWYVERIEKSDPKPKRLAEEKGISPNPAWYGVVGRAEGFASTLGTGQVRPVDLLLALLWDNREWLPVTSLGIARETVVEALVRAGVAVPAVPMPELDRPFRNLVRVDFPMSALGRVIESLRERHPPGSGLRWGFNHDEGERAWAFAEEGVDLQTIVDEVIATQDG
jgi:hypothetical protein